MSPRTKEQLNIIRSEKVHLIGEAALRLFASKGYESTTISEVAREAGVSKGLIYNYFDSKEDMLKNLVNRIFDSMWNRFQWDDLEVMTDEDYKRFINISLDIVLEDLDHFRLYFAIFTQPMVVERLWDDMMEKSGPYLKLMTNYFESKGFKDPVLQMRYSAAVIDGIQMHIMLDPENFPIDEVRKILIKQLVI